LLSDCSVVLVILAWLDVEVQGLSGDLLVESDDIEGGGLEVTGGIVALGDEE